MAFILNGKQEMAKASKLRILSTRIVLGKKKEENSLFVKILPLVAVSAIVFLGFYEPTTTYPDGILVKEEPLQQNITPPYDYSGGDYTITVMAEFDMDGKVLSKERYRMGRFADLVPYDLALGWKEMSDEAVLRDMDITQHGRWYYWQSNEKTKLTNTEIGHRSSNMHMSPVGSEVRKTMDRVRRGDIINLSGKLINITTKDGGIWKTSLSRKDGGGGACEIVLVEKLIIK